MRNLQTNPRPIIISEKPPLSEEEARLIYTATGFYPWHITFEQLEGWLSKEENPRSALLNGLFAYGGVMLFEHDVDFLEAKTQDFMNLAKGSLIDFSFLSDEELGDETFDTYSVADIRSLIPISQMLLGNKPPEQSYNFTFLEHLVSKGFLAEQTLQLIREGSVNTDLSAHQLFHDGYDFRTKYLFPSDVSLSAEFSEGEDVLCGFQKSMSQPSEGYLAFTREQARELQSEGKRVIFSAQNINHEDFSFIASTCDGFIICAEKEEGDAHLIDHLVGMSGLYFSDDEENSLSVTDGQLQCGDKSLKFGDFVVLDTNDSRLITANASAHTTEPYPEFSRQFLQACDTYRHKKSQFGVHVNISNPMDTAKVNDLNVDGIGLVRTEYFFLSEDRITCLKSALADADSQAIANFQAYQKSDFTTFFNGLNGHNDDFQVTVRLLDPKPSELLDTEERQRLKERTQTDDDPRGVQIISTTPELYSAQASAVLQAAQETGFHGDLRILVPFVSSGEEMRMASQIIEGSASQVGFEGALKIGVMLETFNSLTNIKDIVPHADFANIGPKDLTVEFLGGLREHQRDEIKAFLSGRCEDYRDLPFGDKRPYENLHSEIKEKLGTALAEARAIKPDFEVVVCGDEIWDSNSSLKFAVQHTQGVSVPLNQRSVASSKFVTCHHIFKPTS